MNKLLNWHNKFWTWYDNMNEPYRFLFMFVICSPFFVGEFLIQSHQNLGLALMSLIIPIVLSRICFKTLKNKT